MKAVLKSNIVVVCIDYQCKFIRNVCDIFYFEKNIL